MTDGQVFMLTLAAVTAAGFIVFGLIGWGRDRLADRRRAVQGAARRHQCSLLAGHLGRCEAWLPDDGQTNRCSRPAEVVRGLSSSRRSVINFDVLRVCMQPVIHGHRISDDWRGGRVVYDGGQQRLVPHQRCVHCVAFGDDRSQLSADCTCGLVL